MSVKLVPDPRRNSVLGIISHDTKKHRRDQIFEDGFDFTLAATRKEMAKQQGGFDKTKVCRAAPGAWAWNRTGGMGRGSSRLDITSLPSLISHEVRTLRGMANRAGAPCTGRPTSFLQQIISLTSFALFVCLGQ